MPLNKETKPNQTKPRILSGLMRQIVSKTETSFTYEKQKQPNTLFSYSSSESLCKVNQSGMKTIFLRPNIQLP